MWAQLSLLMALTGGALDPVDLGERVRKELSRDGILLETSQLEVRRRDGLWEVELRAASGETRLRRISNLPDDPIAAAGTLRMAVLGLTSPYGVIDPNPGPSASTRRWGLLGGGVLGAGLGVTAGYLIAATLNGCFDDVCSPSRNIPFPSAAGVAGAAAGVALAADALRGGGDWVWAAAGATAGGLLSGGVSALVVAVEGPDGDSFVPIGLASAAVLGVGGAVLLHELLGPGPNPPTIDLWLDPGPGEAGLGLVGRF